MRTDMKAIDYIHANIGDISLSLYQEILKTDRIKKQRKKNFIDSLCWLFAILIVHCFTGGSMVNVSGIFLSVVLCFVGLYYEKLSDPVVVDCR